MSQQPTLPNWPLTRLGVEFSATGYTITGSDGRTLQPGQMVPCGPYTVTDSEGVALGPPIALHDFAMRHAVRVWRGRVESSPGELTFAAVAKQEALKARIRAHEVEIARLECEVRAIGVAHGFDDLSQLDRDVADYQRACDRYREARDAAADAQDRANGESRSAAA